MRRSFWRENLEAFLIAIVFAFFVKTFIAQPFKIPSSSMEGTLLVGDHILVDKFSYGPTASEWERKFLPVRPVERGDIVVFKAPHMPDRDFIKRCMGLPGERFEIQERRVMIDQRIVDESEYAQFADRQIISREAEPYYPAPYRNRDNYWPYTLPEQHYFCMGDNRDNSEDSRVWGTVPRDHIRGRALLVYWSFETERHPIEWQGYDEKFRQLRAVFSGFLSHTRWERTLKPVH